MFDLTFDPDWLVVSSVSRQLFNQLMGATLVDLYNVTMDLQGINIVSVEEYLVSSNRKKRQTISYEL